MTDLKTSSVKRASKIISKSEMKLWGPRFDSSTQRNDSSLKIRSGSKKRTVLRDDSYQIRSLMTREIFGDHRVYLDGVDVTPVPLDNFSLEANGRKPSYSKTSYSNNSQKQSTVLCDHSKSHLQSQKMLSEAVPQSRYNQSMSGSGDMLLFETDMDKGHSSGSVWSHESQGGAVHKIPQKITLILNETETFFVLDLPSATVLRGTAEGDAAEADNKLYEYLTAGKGRHRRVFEAQTYDLVHPMERFEQGEKNKESECDDSDEGELLDSGQVLGGAVKGDSLRKQFAKLVKHPRFQEAVCVIERLLANNCYNEEQKRFRGLSDPDSFRENVEYQYRLKLLWTFSNSKTQGRCVAAMHWNKVNQDVVAVGYGKFYFTENSTGMVMIWNIKNPIQPERQYDFEHPVTSLAFSLAAPNLLAIGFYDGSITVIDISSRDLKVVSSSSRVDSPSFDAAWYVLWDAEEENKEHIIACFDDGRICKYLFGKGSHLKCLQIMHVAKAEGKLKGISIMRKCEMSRIPAARYSAALFVCKHPADPSVYYVGTNEGVVHKCSTNYYNQHLDLFRAHDGPMYRMAFSPFCNRLYLTCGDDWYVRLWAEGIAEPIAEMSKTTESVQGVDWSPTHSSILVVIRGKWIDIWDIQRKIYSPQSTHVSPTDSRNTVVTFTESGRCLVVGDIDGNVHVFSLEDMPFPAFFQDDMLIQSLKRVLVAKPEMLRNLKKLGNLKFKKKF